FFLATIAICLVIVAAAFRLTSRPTAVGLGLILGGALGNLTDRITRGSGISGRVVDFIHVHNWPVFNLADSSIVVGAILVVLVGGEVVVVDLPEPADLEPDAAAVPVLYEDEHLAVVSKPAGLVVHPTSARRTGTLANRLIGMGMPLSRGGAQDRPGIVHRLDAGTSGVMVVAKDDRAHGALAEMFRRHTVDRRYLALVRGRVEHDRFLVDAPLERHRARIQVRASTG